MLIDANSNTIRLVDDNGGTTAWAFDLLDRQTTMTFHDGSTRIYVYDLASDVVGYTDENINVFAITFDVLGRKISIGNAIAQNFEFDGLSRMTYCEEGVDALRYVGLTYDSISRVLEEQQWTAESGTTNPTYYITHNAFTGIPCTGFTYPNCRQITIGFDALYRKNAINEASDSSNIAAWQFFGGRTATVTLGNGIVTSYMNNAGTHSAVQPGVSNPGWSSGDALGYDGAGRLIAKRHLNGTSLVVGNTTAYDPSSNKLFERALHAESRSSWYAMDSMDRLIQYQRGTLATGGASITTPITLPNTDTQRAYALDGLGNWKNTAFTPEGGASETELRTHNKLNQIVAFGVPTASTPITYDPGNNATTPNPTRGNGNIANDGTQTYAWDALNRLITVTRISDGAVLGNYLYDALGRRLNGPTGLYLYDGQQIVEELVGGTTSLQYAWGQYIDEPVQLNAVQPQGPQSVTGVNYLLSDLLFRSAALTASDRSIVEAYDTDAYGNTLLFSDPGADSTWFTNDDTQATYSACRYVFTGREYDAAGRDSFGFVNDANLYAYVTGKVTLALDPSGHIVKLGACELVPNTMVWLDPKWVMFALVPGTSAGGSDDAGQQSFWPRAYFFRRYVDLFKCCSPNNTTSTPFAMYGKPVAAVAYTDDSQEGGRHRLAWSLPLGGALPTPYGTGPAFTGSLGILWVKGQNPIWNDDPRRDPDKVYWTKADDELPVGLALEQIKCCKNNPAYGQAAGWPIPPAPPAPTAANAPSLGKISVYIPEK